MKMFMQLGNGMCGWEMEKNVLLEIPLELNCHNWFRVYIRYNTVPEASINVQVFILVQGSVLWQSSSMCVCVNSPITLNCDRWRHGNWHYVLSSFQSNHNWMKVHSNKITSFARGEGVKVTTCDNFQSLKQSYHQKNTGIKII